MQWICGVDVVFCTRLAAYRQRCLKRCRICGLLLCIDVASVICGVEAVWPKSDSYPSPQPSGVCDPNHPMFLSMQSFATMHSWSLLLSIFARSTIPGWVLLLLLWPYNRLIGYSFQIWYSRRESWLLHSIQKMGSWAPTRRTTPWTTPQSFFLHGSVWNDSQHWWLHCAWFKNEECCMGPPS